MATNIAPDATECSARSSGEASTRRESATDEFVTLGQAAKLAPGRPSSNCLWRWCRRGVLARSGERIRLEHVRLGGRIYTTPRWLDEFGRRLAEADAEYFDCFGDGSEVISSAPRSQRRCTGRDAQHAEHLAHVRRELEQEGL